MEALLFTLVVFVIVGPILGLIALVRSLDLSRLLKETVRELSELRLEVRRLKAGGEPAGPAAPSTAAAANLPTQAPPAPGPASAPIPVPAPAPPQVSARAGAADLERFVGIRLLPFVGVGVVVLGLALLLWYTYGRLGPRGRVPLAVSVGLVMTAGGAWLQRRESYAIVGGCLTAGGWAVLYSSAYAAHFVEASRIVPSATAGFALLFGVGAGAVLHALRSRREWLVGLAYLLIFLTLFLSPGPGLETWMAMAVAAAGLLLLAGRYHWIRLCAVGAVVLYVAEAYWLFETVPRYPVAIAALVGALWALWQLPDFFHRPSDRVSAAFHGLLIVANLAGVLLVGGLLENWLLLPRTGGTRIILGLLYAAKAVLGRRHVWRVAHGADETFAVILVLAGTHDRFEGIGPALAWLGVGALAFAGGVAAREPYARALGHAAVLLAGARAWLLDREAAAVIRWEGGELSLLAVPALGTGLLLYAHAAVTAHVGRRWALHPAEGRGLIPGLLHAGGAAVALAVWYFPPEIVVALLYAAAGLVLLRLFGARALRPLFHQSLAAFLLSAFFVATVNLTATGTVLGVSRRLWATVPVLGAYLFALSYLKLEGRARAAVRTCLSALLLGGLLGLLRFEIGASGAPLPWVAASAVWVLGGLRAGSSAHFVLGALGAMGAVLLYAATQHLVVPGIGLEGPVAVGVPLAAILVGLHVWSLRRFPETWPVVARRALDGMGLALAAAGLALLAREVRGTWLTGAWSVLGLLLGVYGFLLRDRLSRWASLGVLATALVKLAAFDFASFSMPVKIGTALTLGGAMIGLSFVYARFQRSLADYLLR